MISFIETHRAVYGVEPICKVLRIAPSTFYAHAAIARDLSKRRSAPSGTLLTGRRSGKLLMTVANGMELAKSGMSYAGTTTLLRAARWSA